MQLFKLKWIGLSMVILLLCSCARITTPPTIVSTVKTIPAARMQKLSQIHSWNLQGSLSIMPANQTPHIVSYNWLQNGPANYNIKIDSALNLYQMQIIGNASGVALIRSQGTPLHARSPEILLQKTLGWALPVSNLYFWIRGIPAPGPYTLTTDNLGRIATLQQQSWQIQYLKYISVNGTYLPTLISLARPGLALKIVIRGWK